LLYPPERFIVLLLWMLCISGPPHGCISDWILLANYQRGALMKELAINF
jgi:hypothetical protein